MNGDRREPDQPLEQALLRAERLLFQAVAELEQQRSEQERQRAATALTLLRLQTPLQELGQGLCTLMEAMATDNGDTRIRRWQGELQALLISLDGAALEVDQTLQQLEQAREGRGDLDEAEPLTWPLPANLEGRRPTALDWQLLNAELQELRTQLALRESNRPTT